MSYFNVARNVELSFLYAIETWCNADWPGTTVLKTYSQVYASNINLPVVVANLDDTQTSRLEVGSTTLKDRYMITIDIFSTSDGHRLDFSYYLKDKLKDGIVHYDHSHVSGDPSTLSRVANGRDTVTQFLKDSKVELGETVDTKDKFRHNITVLVRNSG